METKMYFTSMGKVNFNNTAILLFIFLLLSPTVILPQSGKGIPPSSDAHKEVQDHDYVPDLRESQQRSPAYNYRMSGIFTKQVNVDQNGLNIVGDAANEPSIAFDPNNLNRMAIGWRQFNTIQSNFRQAGYGYTTNGGQSWTFPGVIEPGIFRSDPVLRSDRNGNFFYNSLTSSSSSFTCQVFKSTSGGANWGNKVNAKGGDKQWMTIDLTDGPGSGNIYAAWNGAFSSCYPGYFTRSANAGVSYENCTMVPNDPYWGTLTVGKEGELYLCGTTGFDFMVAKSLNAQNPGSVITWTVASIVNLDGFITYGAEPNPGGLAGQTQLAVDTSGGTYNGNVYLLCSVERPFDPLDIMFARSTNGGILWSSPVRVNDDQGNSAFQWFGTMSVAPNGRIDAAWLDTRDHPGTPISALYYSYSTNGGLSWSVNQRLSEYFNPHLGWPQQNKMGDYFDMFSDNNGAYLAWAATFNGEQDVYFSYITTEIVPVEFLTFSANLSGSVVNLNWTTATELNNRGFDIERSTDKINWSTIGFRTGAGTTSEQQSYSYPDILSDRASSKLYYRLKQVDFDGSFEYSEIAEVNIAPSEFSLAQNYPNPFNPVTTIAFELAEDGFTTLKVYDIIGNETAVLVNEFKPAGSYQAEFKANTSGTGVYFYILRSGSFEVTKKMVMIK
jgi:hypothetical protein